MTIEQFIEILETGPSIAAVICAFVLALAYMFREDIGARIRGEAAERAIGAGMVAMPTEKAKAEMKRLPGGDDTDPAA